MNSWSSSSKYIKGYYFAKYQKQLFLTKCLVVECALMVMSFALFAHPSTYEVSKYLIKDECLVLGCSTLLPK
jgi:hypothetical protein